jgi:Ankyrin repeat
MAMESGQLSPATKTVKRYFAASATHAHPCVSMFYQLIIKYHLCSNDCVLLNFDNIDNWQRYPFFNVSLAAALLDGNELLTRYERTCLEEYNFKKRCLADSRISKFFPQANLPLDKFISQVLETFPFGIECLDPPQLQIPSKHEEDARQEILAYRYVPKLEVGFLGALIGFFSGANDETPSVRQYETERLEQHKRYADYSEVIDGYSKAYNQVLAQREHLLGKQADNTYYNDLYDIIMILRFAIRDHNVWFTRNDSVQNLRDLTVLHIAAQFGCKGVVKDIVELARHQCERRGQHRVSPGQALHALLEAPTSVCNYMQMSQPRWMQETPALSAMRGFTPLILAVMHGHEGVVKDLLECGADVQARTEMVKYSSFIGDRETYGNYDAIYYALSEYSSYNLTLIQHLLNYGGDPFSNHNYVAKVTGSALYFTYHDSSRHIRKAVQIQLCQLQLRYAIKQHPHDFEALQYVFKTLMHSAIRERDVFEYHQILYTLQELCYDYENALVINSLVPKDASPNYLLQLAGMVRNTVVELAKADNCLKWQPSSSLSFR